MSLTNCLNIEGVKSLVDIQPNDKIRILSSAVMIKLHKFSTILKFDLAIEDQGMTIWLILDDLTFQVCKQTLAKMMLLSTRVMEKLEKK